MIETKKTLLLLGMLLSLAACHNFYMARQLNTGNAATKSIDSLKMLNRYFILRSGQQAFYMKDMSLSKDRKTLTATLDTLPPEHQLYLTNGRNGKMQYKKYKPEDQFVFSEVHLYAPMV